MYLKTLIILIYEIGALVFSICKSELCTEKSKLLVLKDRLATKTGYFSADKDESYWKYLHEEMKSGECIPIKIWFLTRHGTRYPVSSDIDGLQVFPKLIEEILDNHQEGLGCLDEQHLYDLEHWITPYEPKDRGELHSAGAEEMYSMGQYWRNLLPDIFQEPYNSSSVKVEFTVRNRTGQSAYHFLRGLYGDEAIGRINLPQPYEPNFILRFYRDCPRWLRDVKNNSTTFKERHLFQQTQLVRDTVMAVSERLGYKNMLHFENVTVMYEECRFEMAWFPEKESVWCKPFSNHDIKVLEYHQDLKYYYEDSYGTPLNKEIACKTLSDLYSHFRTIVQNGPSLPNAVLYFSHDKALMKFQALLGLFKPVEHLMHNNLDPDRKFRSSLVMPFGSNIAFVLYKCGLKYRVSLFFQGNPMSIPSICSSVLCDWKDYEAFLQPISENCDINKFCMLHDEL